MLLAIMSYMVERPLWAFGNGVGKEWGWVVHTIKVLYYGFGENGTTGIWL